MIFQWYIHFYSFLTDLSFSPCPSLSQEQLKQSVDGEEEGRDIDTLVHETDSQYGTWETGLRTDDR